MINQKQLTLKLDLRILGALESEAWCTGEKRNRLINEAVAFYCRYKDARRADRVFKDPDRTKSRAELQRWETRWGLD